jgi:hypothetical protein
MKRVKVEFRTNGHFSFLIIDVYGIDYDGIDDL